MGRPIKCSSSYQGPSLTPVSRPSSRVSLHVPHEFFFALCSLTWRSDCWCVIGGSEDLGCANRTRRSASSGAVGNISWDLGWSVSNKRISGEYAVLVDTVHHSCRVVNPSLVRSESLLVLLENDFRFYHVLYILVVEMIIIVRDRETDR